MSPQLLLPSQIKLFLTMAKIIICCHGNTKYVAMSKSCFSLPWQENIICFAMFLKLLVLFPWQFIDVVLNKTWQFILHFLKHNMFCHISEAVSTISMAMWARRRALPAGLRGVPLDQRHGRKVSRSAARQVTERVIERCWQQPPPTSSSMRPTMGFPRKKEEGIHRGLASVSVRAAGVSYRTETFDLGDRT